MNNMTDKGALGCLVLVLSAVLSIVASIAVGVFFGAGFGLLAYALLVAYALVCAFRAFERAGD